MRLPMTRLHRALFALGVCVSGWALLPFASLPSQAFGWALYAEAYNLIFGDGFETGDTSRWNQVIGGLLIFDTYDPDDFAVSVRLNPQAFGEEGESQAIVLRGLTPRLGRDVFALEARRVSGGFTVRLRAARSGGSVTSPWRWLPADHQVLTLEWRRSHEQLEDGYLYLSLDEKLFIWLVDLDNAAIPLRKIGASRLLENRLGAVDLSGRRYGTAPDETPSP